MQPTLTKILVTVGPACGELDVLRRLVDEGVRLFRLNFSHGSEADHAEYLRRIRAVESEIERPLAVLGDLQGPRIRVAGIGPDGVSVSEGDRVVVRRDTAVAAAGERVVIVGSTYDELIDDVGPGQRVLIDQGAVRLLVVETRDDELACTVTHGGTIRNGKGINLPETELSVKALDDRDWAWVDWALEHGVDALAQSFVRTASEVRELRDGIARRRRERGADREAPSIVAKIEHPRALREIDDILDAADAIMIARGDLGVEIDLARVPIVQKELTQAAHAHGKPCIVATQMLESMIESRTPTRAEASDVAAAVLDRVDAVMLSGETAIGRYPLLTVEHMHRIAAVTERYIAEQPPVPSAPERLVASRSRTAALAHGVWTVSHDIGARVIVVWSQAGGGARYLSQNRFHVPIVATTSDLGAARKMRMMRGVVPLLMDAPHGMAAWSALVDEGLIERELADPGDPCVLVSGAPLGRVGVTNGLVIHTVGETDAGFGGAGHEP